MNIWKLEFIEQREICSLFYPKLNNNFISSYSLLQVIWLHNIKFGLIFVNICKHSKIPFQKNKIKSNRQSFCVTVLNCSDRKTDPVLCKRSLSPLANWWVWYAGHIVMNCLNEYGFYLALDPGSMTAWACAYFSLWILL